ncbi:MAG: type II toxin-antitoxin system VapC family toxin [Janthinobacterium lividum]
MKLLLDTHIFLRYIANSRRVPTAWVELLRDPQNQIFLSVVSFWEVIIKYQTGKLPLPEAPEIYIPRLRIQHQINMLSVDETDVAYVAQLPSIHHDPFDRLLIAQSLRHGLTFLTVDANIRTYPMISVL